MRNRPTPVPVTNPAERALLSADAEFMRRRLRELNRFIDQGRLGPAAQQLAREQRDEAREALRLLEDTLHGGAAVAAGPLSVLLLSALGFNLREATP